MYVNKILWNFKLEIHNNYQVLALNSHSSFLKNPLSNYQGRLIPIFHRQVYPPIHLSSIIDIFMVVRAKHNIFVSLIVFPSGPAAVRVPPIYKYSKITFVYANCSVPCLVKLESICLSGFASRAGCANVNPRQMSFRYRFCVRHKPKFSNSTNEKKNTRKA